jgi:hypothetical protein
MRNALPISLALLVAGLSMAAVAGAREIEQKIRTIHEPATQLAPSGAVFGVSQVSTDTFYYGGTVWDAGDGRWEAAEPPAPGWTNRKMWTWSPGGFAGTLHSGLNMDGWEGVDNLSGGGDHFKVQSTTQIGACIIGDEKSLFCGKTNAECVEQCYVDLDGTGYGNHWNQIVVTPGFQYHAGDEITLSYDYANETEPGYDFTYVILETFDAGIGDWVEHATLATYEGVLAGTELKDVDSYLSGVDSTEFRIKFRFVSDGGWSDEDNWYPTWCGAVAFDNVTLSGAVALVEDFEGVPVGALPAGWEKLTPGVGDYASAQHLNDLPIGLEEDPCVVGVPGLCEIADSVIILCDLDTLEYPHPLDQDNMIVSPIIDFSSHPGLSGKIFRFERFADLPFSSGYGDYVFMFWKIRYSPACESGGWSTWLTDNYVYYTREGTSCAPFSMDVSAFVPPSAEQVQMGLGVLNDCSGWWWGGECTYECNVTPYYDNVTFGLYGTDTAPYISMRELDYWQDQFAEDGTLNPASTADTRTPNYLTDLVPPIFGDTLVCRGNAENMEVYFVFRMAETGPHQSEMQGGEAGLFPTLDSSGWTEARMDTAERSDLTGTYTVPAPGYWMCARHEEDATRILYGLPEGTEILPNNVLVPGTRVEYFLKARYVGSNEWFLLPDTTGGVYEEFEILPMMKDDGQGGVEWPCLIVADHFGQRGNWFERNSDRIARHLEANNLDFDIFNKLGPASDLRHGIGRWDANPGQIGTAGDEKFNWGPGATLLQMQGYTHCILNTGDVYGYSVYQQDADMLTTWLEGCSDSSHSRFLWVSGNRICRELNRRTPWGPEFLNNVLCASYVSWSYGEDSGDLTYCLPIDGLFGGRLTCGDPESYVLRSNTCPRSRYAGHNVIDVSTGAGCNALPEIEYHSAYDAVVDVSAVSNVISMVGGPNYRTFTEGYDFCRIRTNDSYWPGSLNCGPDSVLTTWLGCVLDWAGYTSSSVCHSGMIVSVTDPITPKAAIVTVLGQAFPNPMNPTATIHYSIGTPGKVMLRIFDVSGRVIRTLVDESILAGEYQSTWDGKNDRGKQVGSGIYFYQLEAPDFRSAKKIVILQ